MKLFSRKALALAISLASQGALAADTFLNVFYENSPMQGLEVKLDGKVVGTTNTRGAAAAYIEAGAHTIELVRDGVTVGEVQYQTGQDEDAEISITYSDGASEPEIAVEIFKSDDKTVNGYVGGVITNVSGQAIFGAKIYIGEYQTTTNESGVYELAVPRGEYDVEVDHPDYDTKTVESVRVLANLGSAVSLRLSPLSSVGTSAPAAGVPDPIEEVLVLGAYKPDVSSLSTERFATAVVDALDVQQMERFGDSNVASALTRLVGVAVTDSQYINVRGLDGRYISSTLNGILMPSTDTIRRDVQLDLFPSNILESIEVQKTFSSGMLGTTTGGALDIKTKGLPEGREASASVSVGYRSGVTGNDIITYEGSDGDYYGYDTGLRDAPQTVLDATDEGRRLPSGISNLDLARLGVQFQDDYAIGDKEAHPDVGISASYGDLFELGSSDFGFYGAANYKVANKERMDYEVTDTLDTTGTRTWSIQEVALNAYLVAGFAFRDQDEVISRTTVLRSTTNRTSVENGVDSEDNLFDEFTLDWVERQYFTQQLHGKHVFAFDGGDQQLDWRIAFSNTDRKQPDRRNYLYINNNLAISAFERRWSQLDEDSVDLGLDYLVPFDIGTDVHVDLKVGALISDKSRELEQYRFGIRAGSNIDDISLNISQGLEQTLEYYNFALDRVRLNPITADSDFYTADEEITAFYITATTEIGDAWTADLGVRNEDFSQILGYPNVNGLRDDELESGEILPALNLTYAPGDTWQFRFGYSKTVSYPGLVERSRTRLYDDEGRLIIGNPFAEKANVDNIDFRVEYYFSDEESISAAVFYKDITDPLEKARPDASGSAAQNSYTFRNANAAELTGLEIDFNKNVVDNGDWLAFVSGNVSFIESEVDLDEVSIRIEGEDAIGRELQGQSPFLANLQLGIDHFPSEQKFTLLFNYFDDRIDFVTRGAALDNELESGRLVVDLNYEKLFGDKLTLKAQAKNILNEPFELTRNGQVIESYKQGAEFSLSVSYDFF